MNLHGKDITADEFEYLKETIRETNIVEITTSYHADDNPVVIKNDGLLSGKEAEINKFCEDNKTSYMPELLDNHHHVVYAP